MGLYEEVAGKPVRRWTRAVVDERLGDDADDLAALLADPAVSPFAICKALRARGIGVSKAAIYQWAEEARQ